MEKILRDGLALPAARGWRSEVRTRNGNGGKDGQLGHAGGGTGRVDAGTTDVRCRVHGTVQPSTQSGVPYRVGPCGRIGPEQHPCLHPAHGHGKRRQGEAEIRLLEPVDVGGMYIPANTVLTATARINGERMELTVSSIAYKGRVVPVETGGI